MDQNNQIISNPIVQPVKSDMKKCNHIPVIIILAILAIGGIAFGGFELYENLQTSDQSCNSEVVISNSDNNDANNEDANERNTIVTGVASFAVPNPYDEGTNDGTVKFEYGIYNDVLFTYSISYHLHPYGHVVSEVVSNNVNINTGEKLDNTKVLEYVDVTIEEVYRTILENLASTVSIDSFLLNTEGVIGEGSISVTDFKNNIDKYVDILKSNPDLFYVFLKDSKVAVSYEQNSILEKLGMSSHMGAGLVGGYVEVEL